MCRLLSGVRSIPVLLQWHVKDPGHSGKGLYTLTSEKKNMFQVDHDQYPLLVSRPWPIPYANHDQLPLLIITSEIMTYVCC